MSTISEIVEREAAEAEAEPDESDTPDTPEPDDEPETPDAHAEKVEAAEVAIDHAEREKKLKAEDSRHENALKRIYGDDFDKQAFCPLCIGQGFLEPIPPGGQPDEIWEAVIALSGRLPSGNLRIPPEYVVCERCGGDGNVGTPATGRGVAEVPCSLCDSRGWFNTEDPVHRARLGLPAPSMEVPPVVFPTFHAPEPMNGTAEKLMPPDGWHAAGSPGADTWGRWPGHPRFGIDPANGGY